MWREIYESEDRFKGLLSDDMLAAVSDHDFLDMKDDELLSMLIPDPTDVQKFLLHRFVNKAKSALFADPSSSKFPPTTPVTSAEVEPIDLDSIFENRRLNLSPLTLTVSRDLLPLEKALETFDVDEVYEFNASGTELLDSGLARLSPKISLMVNLTLLDLSNNYLDEDSWMHLSAILEQVPSVIINICGNPIASVESKSAFSVMDELCEGSEQTKSS